METIESVPVGVGGQDVLRGYPPPGKDALEFMRVCTTHQWAVVVTWEISDGGRAIPTTVALHALRGQPVTATAWRAVPVTKVMETARERTSALAQIVALNFPGVIRGLPEPARDGLTTEPTDRRPGRPAGYSDDHYREVARIYLQAVASGSRSSVRAVAKHFGVDGPRDARAKGWVAEARRRGYIPKGGK